MDIQIEALFFNSVILEYNINKIKIYKENYILEYIITP